MPYRIQKQDCEQSDGKKGSYVLQKKKGDKWSKASCHTSEEKAKSAMRARGMNEEDDVSEGRKVRITKRQLKRIIQEEVSRGSNVAFDWTPSGLAMVMYVNGKEAMSFMTQEEVRGLITQLEDLLAGPMRTTQ